MLFEEATGRGSLGDIRGNELKKTKSKNSTGGSAVATVRTSSCELGPALRKAALKTIEPLFGLCE